MTLRTYLRQIYASISVQKWRQYSTGTVIEQRFNSISVFAAISRLRKKEFFDSL